MWKSGSIASEWEIVGIQFEKSCTELSYRLSAPAVDFDIARFASAFDKGEDGWDGIVLARAREASRDFHAHAYWRRERKKPSHVQLQVDFHWWKTERKVRAMQPPPDDFFPWAAQFFTVPVANFHVHGEFVFSADAWQVKIMPLPLKIPFVGSSALVEGISIEMPTEPEGIDHSWVEIRKKRITIQLFAFRRVEFAKFTLGNELKAFSCVAESLVEEKQQ